jgi:hypothetical protein
LAVLLSSSVATAALAQSMCAPGNTDAFLPFDRADLTANGTLEYNSTGYYPSFYGPDLGVGTDSIKSVKGGAQHLTDGQNIAGSRGITGLSGVKPICANGSLPTGATCADGSIPTIGIVQIGQSLGHRFAVQQGLQNTASTPGLFLSQRAPDSFLDFWVAPSHRVDYTGAENTTYAAVKLSAHATYVDCAQENHNIADSGFGWDWGQNLSWTDSTTPSAWWTCANVRLRNYGVTGSPVSDGVPSQVVQAAQVQVVEALLALGLVTNGTTNTQATILPLSNLNGGVCTSANIDGGAGPVIYVCDIAYYMGQVLRNLKVGFPNIKMVFLDTIPYEGYTSNVKVAPPCDYEYAFAVKKVIEAQILEVNGGGSADPLIGSLNYKNGTAPYLAWGHQWWAQGSVYANADGQTWVPGTGSIVCIDATVADYNTQDCTHESTVGTSPFEVHAAPSGASNMAYTAFQDIYNNSTTGSKLWAFAVK